MKEMGTKNNVVFPESERKATDQAAGIFLPQRALLL